MAPTCGTAPWGWQSGTVIMLYIGHVRSLQSLLDAVESGQALAERQGEGVAKEVGVQAGPLQHAVLGGCGNVESADEPSLQRQETVKAREESKGKGSNNVNNDSSGAPIKMSARVRATTTAAAMRTAAGARARAV